MFLQTETGYIYYEINGPDNAPAIAFTHGGGLHSGMFAAQVSHLKNRYRTITWDMQGHGQSAALTGNLDVPLMAAVLLRIMDEAGVKEAVLVGQSLGVWVTQHVAARSPDRVAALVSIGGLPLGQSLSRREMAMLRVAMPVSRLLPWTLIYRRTAKEKTTTPQARQFFEDSMARMGKRQFFQMLAGQFDAIAMGVTYDHSHPLLITHGQHEMPKSLIKANREWHASVPGSHYYEVPGAGHNANQDRPEEFNRALLDFLHAIDYVPG